MLIILCFNDCNRVIRIDIKDIVRLLRLLSGNHITTKVILAIGNLRFHSNAIVWPFGHNGRRNKLKLNIFLSHLVFL